MPRSRAPRTPQTRYDRDAAAARCAPKPDPNAIHHFRCMRCERLIWAHGIATECHQCIDSAIHAYGMGPVRGEEK